MNFIFLYNPPGPISYIYKTFLDAVTGKAIKIPLFYDQNWESYDTLNLLIFGIFWHQKRKNDLLLWVFSFKVTIFEIIRMTYTQGGGGGIWKRFLELMRFFFFFF